MNKITLEKTCECCPEQYWAYKGPHRIGYIRLRWGNFTCDYLPKENLSNNDIRLIEHKFNDEYKGCFDNEEERNFWLEKSKEELLKYYTTKIKKLKF